MAYHARMTEVAMPISDNYLPPVRPASELERRPTNFLDNLATWAAMIGVLILLAGGVVIASMMWFVSILFAGSTPDEGPGE